MRVAVIERPQSFMVIEWKLGIQKRESRRSLIRSLSKLVGSKHSASISQLAVKQPIFEENDDAVSMSFLGPYGGGHDENLNVLNRKKQS